MFYNSILTFDQISVLKPQQVATEASSSKRGPSADMGVMGGVCQSADTSLL